MIGKKTYLVDGESVEVDEKDLSAFIKSYPNAKEAKSFIVDNDTVDVELPHVETFIKSYPNAKPLYEDAVKKKEYPLPSQIGSASQSPYAPLSLSQESSQSREIANADEAFEKLNGSTKYDLSQIGGKKDEPYKDIKIPQDFQKSLLPIKEDIKKESSLPIDIGGGRKKYNLSQIKNPLELVKETPKIKDEPKGSIGGALFNSLVEGYTKSTQDLADFTLKAMAYFLPSEWAGAKTKEEALDNVNNTLKDLGIKETLDKQLKSEGTSEEYIKKMKEGGIIPQGVLGLTESIFPMLSPKMSGFFVSGFTDAVNEIKQANPSLSANAQMTYGTAQGAIQAALEKFGFRNVLENKSVVKALTNKLLSEQLQNKVKKISANESIKLAEKIVTGAASEFETGATQYAAEEATKQASDLLSGKDSFKFEGTEEFLKNVIKSGATEAVGGGVISTIFNAPNYIKNVSKKNEAKEINKQTESLIKEVENPNISDESKQVIKETIIENSKKVLEKVEEDHNEFESLTDDKKKIVESINSEIKKKEAVLNDENVSKETKDLIENDIQSLSKDIENVKKEGIAKVEIKNADEAFEKIQPLTKEEINELRGLEIDKEESPEDFTKEDEARLNELKQKQATKSKQEQLVGSVGVVGDVDVVKLKSQDWVDDAEKIVNENKDGYLTLYHGSFKEVKPNDNSPIYLSPSAKEANDYLVSQADDLTGSYGHIYSVKIPISELQKVNDIDNGNRYKNPIYSPNERGYVRIDTPSKYNFERVDDDLISDKINENNIEVSKPKQSLKETTKSTNDALKDVESTERALREVSNRGVVKNDEPLKEWDGYPNIKYKLGDKINSNKLPNSQAEPPSGEYILSVVPLSSVDVVLAGMANRDAFKQDDYDGWQTGNLNMIKEGFDTIDRDPVIAIKGNDGLLRLVDGHHRITIASELGRKSILAFVKDEAIGDSKKYNYGWFKESFKGISEAYHKAKADGSNPELVKAVEQSLKEQPIEATPAEVIPPTEQTKGNKLFSEPAPDIVNVSESYKKNNKIETPAGEKIYDIDVEEAKKRADAYDEMKHDPNNPEVKASYEAMAKETLEQHKHLMDNGYTIEIYEGEGEPYKNSNEMLKDLRENKHLFVLSTERDFGQTPITEKQRSENPLLKDSGFKDVNGKPLLVNDVFRFVHDAFGHGERGNSFGAKGEENAWDVHARMFSPLARRAMTTETRGQNSWVNFGKHLRNPDGTIKKVSAKEKPFAEQKIGLLPEWVSEFQSEQTINVSNAPSGHFINVGLLEGKTNKQIPKETVLSALPKDVKVVEVKEVDAEEPTISIELSRPLTKTEMTDFLKATGQKAIPQLSNGKGVMYGAKDWGEFNPRYFVMPDNIRLSEKTAPVKEEKRVSQAQAKIIERTKELANNVVKALKSVNPDAKVVMHDTPKSFAKAAEDAGADGQESIGAGGFHNPNTGEIHLNLQHIASNTLFHEGVHPILNAIEAIDPTIIEDLYSQLLEVEKELGVDGKYSEVFARQYAKESQKMEALTEFLADVADGKITINRTNFEKVRDIIVKMLSAVGIDVSEKIKSTDDLIAIAKKISKGFESGVKLNIDKSGEPLTKSPITIPKFQFKIIPSEKVKVGNHKLSFVKESDLFDIEKFLKEVSEKKQKIWFWTADQLGRGMYYDKVVGGEHYLDAGASYALDPTNRDKGVIWATGKTGAWIEKKIEESDYIAIISGSPEKSKLFNKQVFDLFGKRIGDFNKFKKAVLKTSNVSEINNILKEFDSFEDLKNSPKRKDLLVAIGEQKGKKTPLVDILNKYNAFMDYNDLRDGFYKDNDFKMNDIMLVLKPESFGGESSHSTYENDVLGKVIGVPDKKINAYDLLPSDVKEKYETSYKEKNKKREAEGGKPLTIGESQKSQAVAPYGVGIKEIRFQKPKKGVDHIENAGKRKEMTEDDKGNYLFFHYSDTKFNKLNPEKVGKHLATSRGESPRIKTSHLYTRPDRLEPNVPNANGYVVAVPKEKVYHFNTDPLNLLPEAKKRFRKENGKDVAFDLNNQVAYVSKIASEKGFPITTSDWNIKGTKALRAQTTESLPVEKYSGIKEGTYNQIEFNPKYEDVKPNAKRKDIQFQRIISVNGKDINVKKTQIDVVNGFYSPLEKIISESKFDKLPAKQWLDKFVKGDEAKWTGLTEWLSQQQGSVSKADIQKYLKDNRIEIVEVVKGGFDDGEVSSWWNDEGGANEEVPFEELSEPEKQNARDRYKDEVDDFSEGTTKFEKYQLEGEKENYKEVLVTLPVTEGQKSEIDRLALEAKSAEELADNMFNRANINFSQDALENGYSNERDRPFISQQALSLAMYQGDYYGRDKLEERLRYLVGDENFEKAKKLGSDINEAYKNAQKKKSETSKGVFKSSHFDEPNILVHLRMNTRTDAEGNKVLFLEEVQSDWGQEGKKKGFDEKYKENEVTILDKNAPEANQPDLFWYFKVPNNVLQIPKSRYKTVEEAKSYVLNDKKKIDSGVSQAPFVTDTNAWTKLGLKVALKEAVKQGADKIAWTTGEQQNERYDLSKQVDKIVVSKDKNGQYSVKGIKGNSNPFYEENIPQEKLYNYIGKELAAKAINEVAHREGKTYEGKDLKVGGSGMKGFYGSPEEGKLGIVGEVAKSLFKQEPKTVKIQGGEKLTNPEIIKDIDTNGDNAFFVVDDKGFKSKPFYNRGGAEQLIEDSVLHTQHSIDITPELKAEVQKGLPMFQFNNEKKVIDKINQLIEEGFTKERALDIVKSTKSFKKAVASGQISEQQITDEILGTGEKKEAATKKKIVEGEGGISKEAKEELSKRGVEYIEKQQSVSQKEANDIIASFEGRESDLEAHILNKSNAILDDVRVAIVQALIMKYSKDANIAESEGDINKRNKITIRQVDLIENLSEMVRENARALSIMNDKVWKAFINSNPQAVAASYRRKLDKRNELSLKEHKGTIKTFIDAIKNFKEEFENAITEAMVERGYAKEERVKKTRNIFKDIEFQYGADGKLTPQRGSSKYGIPDEIKGAAKEYAIQQVSSNNKNAVENTIAYINKEIEKLYNEGKIFSKSWDEAQFRADKKTEFSKNSEKDLEKWLQKKIDKIESLDENQKRVFLGDIFNELYSNGQVSDERVKELFGKAIGLPYANQETLTDLMKLQESIVEADKALEEYLKIKNPTYKDALKFKIITIKAQQANNAKARLFQKADPEWKTFWDLMTAALQGGLLAIKSLVTNVNAYLYNNPLRAIARSFFGGGIEYLVSKAAKIILRNKVSDKYDYWTKPELLQGYWKGVGEYWTQKAEGLVEGIVDLWYGTSPDDYKDMPQFGGLRPALGWADAGKEFVNGLKSMSNKEWKQAVRHSGKVINGLAEGIIGVVPESMFRGLGVGDKPFRRAAMASRGVEIYVMSDVKAKHGVTFRQFMADPDRFVEGAKQDMIDYATTYTYQNKNIIYSLMTSASGTLTAAIDKNVTNKNIEAFINTIAPVLKFAAKTQTPYINTPLNVGWELLKWTNPMLSISIGISQVAFGEKNNSMFNKKDGYTNIGIGITGYIMLTMIAKMAELGMMSGGDDEDKKERQRGYEYIEGGKFNHSAFMRWVSGGSPKEQSGDKWWGVEKLGNVGMAFIVKHKMEEEKKDKEKKGEEFSESASALRSTIQTVLNSTFLTGVNRVVEGFLKGEREMNQWILGTAEAALTPFAPNLFMSIGKANDEYLRETKDITLSNQLKNKLKQKWFSGSDLPPKISIWGEPIKARPEDWKDDQYLYEFFNIVKSKGYEPNQYGVELYKLSLRTDDLGALPSPASREIGGKKLSPEEYYRYAMLKGKLSRMYADDYINSINWKEDSDEQKIKELENIYSKATEDASKAMKGKLGLDEKIEEGLKSNYNLPKGVRQEMLDNISKTIFNTNWKK